MPQMLTMIQTEKVTPAPSVIAMTLLALCYLTSSNIIVLMNYVGFATWYPMEWETALTYPTRVQTIANLVTKNSIAMYM
jgi:hypothetical protein